MTATSTTSSNDTPESVTEPETDHTKKRKKKKSSLSKEQKQQEERQGNPYTFNIYVKL